MTTNCFLHLKVDKNLYQISFIYFLFFFGNLLAFNLDKSDSLLINPMLKW